MYTYAELRDSVESNLKSAKRDLEVLNLRLSVKQARYGRSYDLPERRVRLVRRIAELELNLEALDCEHAARCAAADPTE